MTNWPRRVLFAGSTVLLLSGGKGVWADLGERFDTGYTREKGRFLTLSRSELAELEQLFTRIFAGEPVRSSAAHPHWRLQYLDDQTLALQQRNERGGGYYRFRLQGEQRTFLQAPHRKADRYTGTLAYRLFQQGGFGGAAWNSLNRRNIDDGSRRSDLAHQPLSPFNAHARAIAARYPDATLIQLHGFSQAKRKTPQGAGSDIIISASTRYPSARVRGIYRCLKGADLGLVRLYPTEVRELGGTTNVTARTLLARGFTGFVHLEMSAPLRRRLMQDDAALTRLGDCLR